MMRCATCDNDNPERAKFCLECGSPLTAATVAERRQVMCLFCDLVDSVELSERLDQKLRETLGQYHRVCTTVVRRFEGYVHDYLGDGIMVYFGFPAAHEDDTQRAVRSALGIIDAVAALSSRTAAERGIELHVRIGIDCGQVVAGRLAPAEGPDDTTAIGVTPNMAARLQNLAAPDSIVVSAAAYRLAGL